LIVTVVYGQNHRGTTYHAARMLAEALTDEDSIREIFLPRDLPEFCCGCSSCLLRGEETCPHYEALRPLVEKLDEADVMIFASPVYVYHVTGAMKSFLDHFGCRWVLHRPDLRMFRKQAVCVTTAAGAGNASACKDIRDSMFFWGVPRTYSCGFVVHALTWDHVTPETREKIRRRTARLAEKIRREQGRVRPGLKARANFRISRKLVSSEKWNPLDRAYWEKTGLLHARRPWDL
jgi:Multimeric flavodoxin WrbA